jgi:hypothetical protein
MTRHADPGASWRLKLTGPRRTLRESDGKERVMSRKQPSISSFAAGVFGAVLLASVHVTGQSGAVSLAGVWKVSEVTMTGPAAGTVKPQADLTIISAHYYSRIYVEQPRPELSNPAAATADELRAAWGPFVGEAGTYELTGDHELTMRPIVAKNPAAMAPGAFVVYSWTLTGDTLIVTPKRNQNGPVANPPTIKLVKIE